MAKPLSDREAWALREYQRRLGSWQSGEGEEMSDEDFRLLQLAEDNWAKGNIPVAGTPGNAPVVQPAEGPEHDIRRLRQAISAGMGDGAPRKTAATEWGPYVPEKSPAAIQASERTDAFHQNIARNYPHPTDWKNIPPDVRRNHLAYVGNADGYQDKVRSGYETTGVIGPGSTLGAAGGWLQSGAGMLYGVGGMVGNAMDEIYYPAEALGSNQVAPYGNAAERTAKSAATFLAPFRDLVEPATESLYGPTEDPLPSSHYADGRDLAAAYRSEKDAIPWDHPWRNYAKPDGQYWVSKPEPTGAGLAYWNRPNYGLNPAIHASQPEGGEDYFVSMGVPRGLAGVIGAGTDALFNPFFGANEAVAASKLLPRIAPMAKWAAGEFGLDGYLLGQRVLGGLGRDQR